MKWILGTALILLLLPRAAQPGTPAPAAEPAGQQDYSPPERMPEFIGTDADWLNTPDGKALKRKKNTVYVVDFWEYTCVNCLRTLPYLQEWHKRYAKHGLTIIGIHTPEFDFAKKKENVAAAAKRLGITWPVLNDSEYKNWRAYNNAFWPRKYFINKEGRIVDDHAGEGGYGASEARIQQLLKEINPKLELPQVMEAVRDADKPGAVCYPVTPELYAGERGAVSGHHGNIPEFAPGRVGAFKDPGPPHEDGRIFLQGAWRTEEESLRHARASSGLSDWIAIRYHALECNAVIRPEGGKPYRVTLFQDGKPIAQQDKGDDIRYDEKGRSYIEVDAPRMYSLVKNAKFGSHELKLACDSPDFGLYAFTFSSCEIK